MYSDGIGESCVGLSPFAAPPTCTPPLAPPPLAPPPPLLATTNRRLPRAFMYGDRCLSWFPMPLERGLAVEKTAACALLKLP